MNVALDKSKQAIPNEINWVSDGFSNKVLITAIKPTIIATEVNKLMILVASVRSLKSKYDIGKKIAFMMKITPIKNENSKSTSTYL